MSKRKNYPVFFLPLHGEEDEDDTTAKEKSLHKFGLKTEIKENSPISNKNRHILLEMDLSPTVYDADTVRYVNGCLNAGPSTQGAVKQTDK